MMKILVIEDNESVSAMIELFFQRKASQGIRQRWSYGLQPGPGYEVGLLDRRLDAARNGWRHNLSHIEAARICDAHHYADSQGQRIGSGVGS